MWFLKFKSKNATNVYISLQNYLKLFPLPYIRQSVKNQVVFKETQDPCTDKGYLKIYLILFYEIFPFEMQ